MRLISVDQVILSTNIAESSITVCDIKYGLNFSAEFGFFITWNFIILVSIKPTQGRRIKFSANIVHVDFVISIECIKLREKSFALGDLVLYAYV